MVTGADTSFLFSLYANDVHSPRATAWLAAHGTAVTISVLAQFELENALRFATWRGVITAEECADGCAQFAADHAAGRIVVPPVNLALVVAEARRLSSRQTLDGGYRSFDILHVAAAVVAKAERFLSFDANQKRLAIAAGLTVPL